MLITGRIFWGDFFNVSDQSDTSFAQIWFHFMVKIEKITKIKILNTSIVSLHFLG